MKDKALELSTITYPLSTTPVYLLYSLLLAVGFLILLPRFIFDALRHGKYAAGFRERLGSLPFVNSEAHPVIWLHCVSVGETIAARPVVERFIASYPNYKFVISTTTLTGQRVAREVFGKTAIRIVYFPFDWRWTVRRALDAVRPSAVLIMETELWANFLRECRDRKIPVTLLNGRISPRSMRNYRRVRFFMRRVVGDISLALMQSAGDAERIIELGLAGERVHITGNVKFDATPPQSASTETLDKRFKFSGSSRPLLVAASTHEGEETLILRALSELDRRDISLCPRLLIAPRRPERFEAVARLLQSSTLKWTRRSALPAATDAMCDAVLLDTIGELPAVYPLATAVFVGGSIVPHGGHNILEPAAVGRAIVTGAHTANFASIVQAFLDAEAILQLPHAPDEKIVNLLADVFYDLSVNEKLNRRLGDRAAAVCLENRGATDRTIELLAALLEGEMKPPVLSSAVDALDPPLSRATTHSFRDE